MQGRGKVGTTLTPYVAIADTGTVTQVGKTLYFHSTLFHHGGFTGTVNSTTVSVQLPVTTVIRYDVYELGDQETFLLLFESSP